MFSFLTKVHCTLRRRSDMIMIWANQANATQFAQIAPFKISLWQRLAADRVTDGYE